MKDYLSDAKEEFKRADHLLYVSLKYTRTVDVFRSIIERLISGLTTILDGLLKKAVDDKKLSSAPLSPKLKCEAVKHAYKDDETIVQFSNFYLMLRRIIRSDYSKINEFRRHVTMITKFDDGEVLNIDMDKIHEYYAYSKQVLEYAEQIDND